MVSERLSSKSGPTGQNPSVNSSHASTTNKNVQSDPVQLIQYPKIYSGSTPKLSKQMIS
jgi:hypothetical protein